MEKKNAWGESEDNFLSAPLLGFHFVSDYLRYLKFLFSFRIN